MFRLSILGSWGQAPCCCLERREMAWIIEDRECFSLKLSPSLNFNNLTTNVSSLVRLKALAICVLLNPNNGTFDPWFNIYVIQ